MSTACVAGKIPLVGMAACAGETFKCSWTPSSPFALISKLGPTAGMCRCQLQAAHRKTAPEDGAAADVEQVPEVARRGLVVLPVVVREQRGDRAPTGCQLLRAWTRKVLTPLDYCGSTYKATVPSCGGH